MKPAQAYCKRCEKLFCYFRYRRPRLYCSTCIDLERQDEIQFNRMQRHKNAVARAVESRSTRHLSRFSNGLFA